MEKIVNHRAASLFEERDRSLHTKKMRTLFAAADESGDGFIVAQLGGGKKSWEGFQDLTRFADGRVSSCP